MQKYGFDDARPVLERASARETAARVALGAVARRSSSRPRRPAGLAHVASAPRGVATTPALPDPGRRGRASTPTRCGALDAAGSAAMVAEVEAARKDGDTLGGVVEVVAYGLPPGLGLARALGPPARRPARGGADGHPGDQGRRGRRRVPHRAPGAGRAAHDEIERDADGSSAAAPAAPAASRAA